MFQRLSRTFITGLLAALPLVLTIAALFWLADFVHDLLGPKGVIGRLLGSIGLRCVTGEAVGYFIGIVIAVAAIYFLGTLVEAGMKNRWNALVGTVLGRVPLVRTVYETSKQLTRLLERDEQTDMKGMSPVVCQLGEEGGTAVLALMPNPEPIKLNGRYYDAVLIPTAPVPFGGAILYVPVQWVRPVDFAFDGLLDVYMSMGGTSPDYMNKTRGAHKAANGFGSHESGNNEDESPSMRGSGSGSRGSGPIA